MTLGLGFSVEGLRLWGFEFRANVGPSIMRIGSRGFAYYHHNKQLPK